jgi:hypothetical protein
VSRPWIPTGELSGFVDAHRGDGPVLADSSIWSQGLDRSKPFFRKDKVMLRSLRQLYGKKLRASDGDIGHVKDFYFNDQQWAIRYVVADTGSWLSGRLVLIPPHAFGNL